MRITEEDLRAISNDWEMVGKDLKKILWGRAKEMLEEHIASVNHEQQKRFEEEFEFLEKLRPPLPDYEEDKE